LRRALLDEAQTDSWRWLHGAADGTLGLYADRWGGAALAMSAKPASTLPQELLEALRKESSSIYFKTLDRQVRKQGASETGPKWIEGLRVPEEWIVRENGLQFAIRFSEGYSVGLFLDQRDNRRRLANNYIARGFPVRAGGLAGAEILNAFSYTCGFSVCAARAGARAVSLDLSRKYLDWGRRNFELNGLDGNQHEFLHGDVFDWFRRLRKKGRQFDLLILDPPTFSSSRASGTFQAARDYGRLVEAATPLVRAGGVLFCSTNAAQWTPDQFLACVEGAAGRSSRRLLHRHYCPQPPDFPVARDEPAYLKTAWFQLA